MGVFSNNMPVCATGFQYSYPLKKCFILKPINPSCSPDNNVITRLLSSLVANTCAAQEGSRGSSYTTSCITDVSGCHGSCIATDPVTSTSTLDHMVCTSDGNWVSTA